MQDGWLLAQIIQHYQSSAASKQDLLARALQLFDSIRSPYYARMYDYLDGPKNDIYGTGTTLSADPAGTLYWIYGLDIRAQWDGIKEGLVA
jgi:salicylate hydroxylase